MSNGRHFEYEIQYVKIADKFFRKHEDVRKEYENAIRELLVGEHPEKVNVKQIQGKRSVYYRIAIGGYRVLFAVINGKIITINTILAGPRGDVYKKMGGLK